jgi:hypothetical protein
MNLTSTSTRARPVAPTTQRRFGRWIALLVLVALAALLVRRGFGFYRLGLAARAGHPDYHTLNPSGLIGHGYGIVGTVLILTNLLYLARRRFAGQLPAWAGSMKAWLDMHAFTGLLGSLLIVFHSAFQLRTPVATMTAASLAIVVGTGLIGFHLRSLVPKAGLKPFKTRLAEIEPLLPGFAARLADFVAKAPVTRLPHDASFARTLLTVPRWMLEARARRRGLIRAAEGNKVFRVLMTRDPALARAFLEEFGDLAAREVSTQAGAAMMRSWRSLHRFLAILMVVSVSVHIAVAWFYGFRWIFDR